MRRRLAAAPRLEGAPLDRVIAAADESLWRALVGRSLLVSDALRILSAFPNEDTSLVELGRLQVLEQVALHCLDLDERGGVLLVHHFPVERRAEARAILDAVPPLAERGWLMAGDHRAHMERLTEAPWQIRENVLTEGLVGRRVHAVQLRELISVFAPLNRIQALHRTLHHWNGQGEPETVLALLPEHDRAEGARLLGEPLSWEAFEELRTPHFLEAARQAASLRGNASASTPKASFLPALRGESLSPRQLEELLRLLKNDQHRLSLVSILALHTDGRDLTPALQRAFRSDAAYAEASNRLVELPPVDPGSLREPDYQSLVARLVTSEPIDLSSLSLALKEFGRRFTSACQVHRILHLMPSNLQAQSRHMLEAHAPRA